VLQNISLKEETMRSRCKYVIGRKSISLQQSSDSRAHDPEIKDYNSILKIY
jgi:hypothetical protein